MPATRSRAHKRSFVEHHHHQHTPSTTSQEINSDDESQIIGSNSSRIINHHGEHSNNNIDNNNNDTSLPSSPRLQPVRKHRRIIRHSTSNVAAVPVASSSTSIPRVAIPSPFILPPQLPNTMNNTNSNNNNNTEDVILIEDDADEFRRHGRNQDDAIVLNSDDEQDDVQVVGSNNVESDSYDEDYDDDDGVESLSDEDIPVHSSMFSHFLQFRNPLLVIPQFRFNGYLMNALQRIRNTPPEPPRNQADIKKVKYNPPDGSEPAECTICLEKLKKNVMAYKTGCDHMFHIKCLDGWLKSTTRPSCPNCRADLHK